MEARYFKNISICASFNLKDVYVDVKFMWKKAGKENKTSFAC